MLGTRMDSRIEGVRGWGVPSESIFEVSQLACPMLVGRGKSFADVFSAWVRRQKVRK